MARSLLPSALIAAALVPALACSSSSAPDGPASNCSYYEKAFTLATGGASADSGSADAGATPTWCLPSDIAIADASASVACTLLVALPASGNESACAPAGFSVPDATTLRAAHTNDPATNGHPTCLVQQATTASCQAGSKASWCTLTGAAAGGCARAIAVSVGAVVPGATYVIGCLEGC